MATGPLMHSVAGRGTRPVCHERTCRREGCEAPPFVTPVPLVVALILFGCKLVVPAGVLSVRRARPPAAHAALIIDTAHPLRRSCRSGRRQESCSVSALAPAAGPAYASRTVGGTTPPARRDPPTGQHHQRGRGSGLSLPVCRRALARLCTGVCRVKVGQHHTWNTRFSTCWRDSPKEIAVSSPYREPLHSTSRGRSRGSRAAGGPGARGRSRSRPGRGGGRLQHPGDHTRQRDHPAPRRPEAGARAGWSRWRCLLCGQR